jgi:carbon starvation protein
MSAMPVMIAVLCLMAIAYRYYSAFLAAKVVSLDGTRTTPAYQFNDGHNYHPTNKWVLFGHHFAAISGAGPLIGPVLAAQFGYMPGLLWIVIGVCLAGAVQDFLVLAASLRRGGKSLAQIAYSDIGKVAGTAATIAILFIVVIALAGLGKVVVKALGGETVSYPAGAELVFSDALGVPPLENGAYVIPAGATLQIDVPEEDHRRESVTFSESFKLTSAAPIRFGTRYHAMMAEDAYFGPNQHDVIVPPVSELILPEGATPPALTSQGFYVVPKGTSFVSNGHLRIPVATPSDVQQILRPGDKPVHFEAQRFAVLPKGSARLVPGSSWGTFTIACTIPIALFVGLYMYKLRPGKVVEASLIGGVLTIGATVLGAAVPGTALGRALNLSANGVTWAMAIYGFIAAVLPVWVLLAPRDYLSSFLKIGTIALLVIGTILANPHLEAPKFNTTFFAGGPTVKGQIFPFLFITIMCGAISGFHALVSSGTTPKMMEKETHARRIGYGAMLIEGLVGVVAMIAAASLPVRDYYAMNTELSAMPKFHDKILQVAGAGGVEHINMYEDYTRESLRGRTGGAVTLAVGMAHIFDGAAHRFAPRAEEGLRSMWKYWYHFAIMFEALFILTTIDAGTRIGRFLLQEVAGKIHPSLGITGGWPSAVISTGLIVAGWGWAISANSMAGIWPMFGVANQMLAVIALAIVSAYLTNVGKAKYLWVTVLPMLFVIVTTSSAAAQMFLGQLDGITTQLHNPPATRDWTTLFNACVTAGAIAAIMISSYIVILAAAMKIWKTTSGLTVEARGFEPVMGK